jgi:hypothetical protein
VARDEVTGGRFARSGSARPSLPWRRRDDGAPRVVFTKEDARRLNARFAELDRADRRAIVRAVNRAWLLGPAIAVFQVAITPIGWQEGLLLGAWGALLLGMMAAWWWTRARRAELENLKVAGGRTTLPRTDAPDDGGRLPGPGGTAPRPPRPRGRKRR